MKYANAFKWLSVILVIAAMIPAIGCGKKEAQEPTPTPTAIPTATTPAEPTGETGTLSSLSGDVQVLRHGVAAWIAAASGMKLGTGDGLKTGGDGYVLITFFDGSVMEVKADSEISVEELSKASGGSTIVRISQVLGNTVNRVENLVDSSSTYEVETLAGSAVVRGTIYSIHVDKYGELTHTCCNTSDEEDNEQHNVDFSGGGVTVKVPEGMTSCCWEGGVPGSPFYTDPSDDPLQFGGDGGGSGCYGYECQGYQPTPSEHCYTCTFSNPTYDGGPFTPTLEIQNVSDSFTAGGCRWYLFHLTAGYNYNFSACEDEGLCLGNAVISFYNASTCSAFQCNTCGNCQGSGCFFDVCCPGTGDYLVQISEDENDAALSYTLEYSTSTSCAGS